MNSYKIEAGTAQHIANRPQQNDRTALFAGARAPGYMMAVLADGGDSDGGANASEQVLHTARQLFDAFKPGDKPSIERLSMLLHEIVDETHLIIKMNAVVTQTEPHATFATLIIAPGGQAVWAHVGDSRLYRFHNGKCKLRTGDAGYIDHLMQADKLAPESVHHQRHSTPLVNVLGNSGKEPFVAIGSHTGLDAGDAFLLCSDGLWHFFTDAELGAAIARNPPRQASELLINKAGERAQGKGGNCTMAIVKLVRPPKDVPDYTVQRMGRAV